MAAYNYNYRHRKLKKLRAISLNPLNIAYDLTAVATQKFGPLHSISNKYWAHARNQRLSKRRFKPVDMARFTLPAETLQSAPRQVRQKLEEYGVCVLTDYVPHEIALAAGIEISDFLGQQGILEDGRIPLGKTIKERDKYRETEQFSWQYDYAKYATTDYRAVQELENPFINIRSIVPGVADAGKIDIFSFEKLARSFALENLLACYDATMREEVVSFIEDLSGYKMVQPNLYYDGGVTTPRGPHLDNNLEQYKLFIYLTDVTEIKNGPYCYAPGSHKKRNWMSKERLINSANRYASTEVSSFPFDGYTRMLGPAGTAIISCQSGIHGGWPQGADGRRALIVSNYN
jgi:hypothetical protein